MKDKKNIIIVVLSVIIVLLVVLIALLVTEKISFQNLVDGVDQLEEKDENNNDTESTSTTDQIIDNTTNTDNEDAVLGFDEATKIVKELMKEYCDYHYSLGAYCGGYDIDDYLSFGSYEAQNFRDYNASVNFKSIDELKKYFRTIMVEELLPKYLDDGVSYLEKDGKLYCQLSHKGPGMVYDEAGSVYSISIIEKDKIVVNAVISAGSGGSILTLKGNIEFIKNSESNWVISKYDVNY